MSEQRSKIDPLDAGREKPLDGPRVTVAVAGEARDIKCDYENVEMVFQSDHDCNAAEMFNLVRNKRSTDLFFFMGADYNFAYDNSLTRMVDELWRDDRIHVGAVYTDLILCDEGERLCSVFNPAYDIGMSDKSRIMNIPFLVKSAIVPSFNTKLNELYLWDGMLQLVKNVMVFHMPCALIDIYNAMTMKLIPEEIQIIQNKHY